MCHRIGRPPTSTIGLGGSWVSSLSRLPRPPARITAFIAPLLPMLVVELGDGEHPVECDLGRLAHGRVDGDLVDHLAVHQALEDPREMWAVDAEHRRARAD